MIHHSMAIEFVVFLMKGETGFHLFSYLVNPTTKLYEILITSKFKTFTFKGKINPAFLSTVDCILQLFKKNGYNLEICEDFHVSLSRTVVLRHHWIEGFTSSLRKQMNDIQRLAFHSPIHSRI